MTVRAGQLNTPATLHHGGTTARVWSAIFEPKNGYTAAEGLRLSPEVVIVLRLGVDAARGDSLVTDDGAIYSLGQPTLRNDRQGLQVSANRLSGTPGTLNGQPVEVAIIRSSGFVGEYANVVEATNVAEIAQAAHPAAPAKGDTLVVDGETWTVDGLATDGDDGVIWRINVRGPA